MAAPLITGKDIKNGSVISKDIKNNNLLSKDLKDGTVSTKDVKNGNLASKDIKNGTVTTDDLKNGGVASGDIKDGTVGTKDMSQAAIDSMKPTFSGVNWSVVDRNVIGAGTAVLRAGPNSTAVNPANPLIEPPLGVGSLGIQTGTSADKAAFGNQVDFRGDLVSDLTVLGYSVFTTGENNSLATAANSNLPSLTFEINPNLAAAPADQFSTLVFFPERARSNRWTTIDATTTGLWGLTGAAGPATGCDVNLNGCTFTDLQAALNDGDASPATIFTVQFSKGRDLAFTGAVDALKINNKTFDFEPTGVIAR